MANRIQIENISVVKKFEDHLSNPENKRILFSAPFGAGKTTFLNDFFSKHQSYIALKLYPINYSIAANQDVFELIKYDLLYELLNSYPEEISLQKDEFSNFLISQMFILHKLNFDLPLKAIIKAASQVKKGVDDVYEAVSDAFNKFTSYKKDVNTNELDIIKKYIISASVKEGHLYEFDEVSQLIFNLLYRIKDTRKVNKLNHDNAAEIETILIIDDLDRLDPEHVFRLFNIFTAHYDEKSNQNKFGFDKVIFVCDVNNIQQMFNHRYGLNVEFGGYIDKFYSTEIFKFDIKKHFRDKVKKLFLNKENIYRSFPEGVPQFIEKRYRIVSNGGFYDTFEYLIFNLIDIGLIRIRNFDRFSNYSLPNYTFKINARNDYEAVQFELLVLLSLLQQFFPRTQDLENAIQSLYLKFDSDYDEYNRNISKDLDENGQNLIKYSLPFLIDDKKIFLRNTDVEGDQCFRYRNETNEDIFVIYDIVRERSAGFYHVNYIKCTYDESITNGKNNGNAIVKPNPFWFLYNAIISVSTKNILEEAS